MNALVRRMTSISLSSARGCLSTVAGGSTNLNYSNASSSFAQPTTIATTQLPRHYIVASHHQQQQQYGRSFSTESDSSSIPATTTRTASVFTDEGSGQQYGMVLDTRKMPKLKPSIVKRRLAKCKTYVGTEKSIRQSPWKLNRVCQLAAGLTLEEALTQLQFCDVKNADLVAKILRRTSNLADIRDGLQISQLEVAECFTTKSMMLKRIKPMGRGRAGIMHHKFSHIRAVLREIDFPLKIYQANTLNQKKKWLAHQHRAEQDAQAAKAKREETERLLKQQEQQLQERKAAIKE